MTEQEKKLASAISSIKSLFDKLAVMQSRIDVLESEAKKHLSINDVKYKQSKIDEKLKDIEADVSALKSASHGAADEPFCDSDIIDFIDKTVTKEFVTKLYRGGK